MIEKSAKSGGRAKREARALVPPPNWEQEQRAARVKKAVKLIGTVQAAADRSGIPKGTLNAYLLGGEMKLSNAAALAAATGVSLEWLATGAGEMQAGSAANRPESLTPDTFSLQAHGDIQLLERAYAAAVAGLAAAGKDTGHGPSIARLIAIFYDDLRGILPPSRKR